MSNDRTFAGVDVGGRKKGFHVAAVDDVKLVAGPERCEEVEVVLDWLLEVRPAVVAVDSPKTCAEAGERSRAGERQLMKELRCGIYFTPEEPALATNAFWEWILFGRELYGALELEKRERPWKIIEVFPTASWTVWAGRRAKRSRARWTREALEAMDLDGLPSRRLNQDDRDAIAAAITARCYHRGKTRNFGEIVVPSSPGT